MLNLGHYALPKTIEFTVYLTLSSPSGSGFAHFPHFGLMISAS